MAIMDKAADVRAEMREPARSLSEAIPEVMSAFAALNSAAFADGALPKSTKELAALAIAIAKECDGCIVAHTRNLARLHVPREQVAELIGVALAMNGGPATVWGPRALAAFDQQVAEYAERR